MSATEMHGTLNVAIDQRIFVCPDGSYWNQSPPAYDFFSAGLAIFDQIRVIARVFSVDSPPGRVRRVDGNGVSVYPIPGYAGPFQYLRRRSGVIAAIGQAARLDGAFLLRIPSQTGFLLAESLDRLNRPYATELLTDPHDFFSPGVAPHGLATCFRSYFCRRSRELCARAVAANFVTGSRTQAAHPTATGTWSSRISDVDLPSEAFLPLPRPHPKRPLSIITVGFLDLLYKGQDLLIRALANCSRDGLDFRLTFAGDGENRRRLLQLADQCGIGSRVHVTGSLAGSAEVRAYLAESDLFVLPSRAEGIPRALIEGMAAGLPAITSNVGAMPDLVPARWVVPADSESTLTAKILEFAAHPELWPGMAAENQAAARGFERDQLMPRRLAFYQAISEASIQWRSKSSEFAHAS